MSGALPRKEPTARQKLLGHLLDRHRPPSAAITRWTLADLKKWHREEHQRPRGHAYEDCT